MGAGHPSGRPRVSVIVPFHGDADDARALVKILSAVRIEPGDEVVVADNSVGGTFLATVRGLRVRAIAAPLERSGWYARNVGAEASINDWLLFVDSHCRPEPGLLDAFFAPPPGDEVGIVSGGVVGMVDEGVLISRYAASRGRRAAGTSANLLVRRAAWEAVHGFHEGVRSGADLEFCRRVQDAGWRVDRRPAARVHHEHARTLAALRGEAIRRAGSGGWVNRHHAGAFHRPAPARHLVRCAAGALVWTAALRPRRALFKMIDALFVLFDAYGSLTGNRAARDPPRRSPRPLVVVAGCWADATDSRGILAVGGLAVRGARPVVVEALCRPQRPDRRARRDIRTTYAEDDGVLRRLGDLACLLARRPLAVLGDAVAYRADGARRIVALAPVIRRVRAAGPGATVVTLLDAPLAMRVAALAGRPVQDGPNPGVAPRMPACVVRKPLA